MNSLELRVFNVGHGLSVALVEKPNNYVTLIDLGAQSGFTPLKYLALKLGLKADILYITHPHADHLDDVETALSPHFQPLGLYYHEYDWEDVKKREKKELAYKIDDFLRLQKKVPFRDYAGSARLRYWYYKPDRARKLFGDMTYVNNSSIFFIYTWRSFKISIAGDLESDGMAGMIDTEGVQQEASGTDILIPSHHGHSNGFPTKWAEKMGKPYVSIISVQQRDEHVDGRYKSPDFARGISFGGKTRYALTTRFDGSILVTMSYGTDEKPKWRFESF